MKKIPEWVTDMRENEVAWAMWGPSDGTGWPTGKWLIQYRPGKHKMRRTRCLTKAEVEKLVRQIFEGV